MRPEKHFSGVLVLANCRIRARNPARLVMKVIPIATTLTESGGFSTREHETRKSTPLRYVGSALAGTPGATAGHALQLPIGEFLSLDIPRPDGRKHQVDGLCSLLHGYHL